MKTILIERVDNGWIVRPFQPCESWALGAEKNVFVYRTVEELQKDIPRLVSTELPKPTTEELINR